MNKTSRNYFLLAVIFFISCNGYGQKTGWASAVPSYDTTFMLGGKNNYDTVKVIMLISDTSNFLFNGSLLIDTSGYAISQYDVHLRFGYKVYQRGQYIINHEPPYTYLDENKKPLSKNIIVWQTK